MVRKQPRSGRRTPFFLAVALLAGQVFAACRSLPPIDAPPGAALYDSALRRRLASALSRRGPGYVPHTRHRRPDGSARWTNRLILESSPYLLQHAHNPVDWYPWGEEAFARARAESKPVLLSVGYSTCHWCHVMEEESFEDEEVATYLNANYVAIKVDREERPDVDTAYMTAVQLLTGRGGWPMTVWLTPLREPFFGGTYFPARDGERGMKVGFLTLLGQLRQSFDANPLRVTQQAAAITERVRRLAAPPAADGLPAAPALHAAYDAFRRRFDEEHGGFGQAPKFPSPGALAFLLRYHRRTGSPVARAMVLRTLDRMAAGGVHDQIGGGFHRYATDRAWRVPHFEKMLYDNAQLAVVYLDASQALGRPDFAAVTRDVLDYLTREMAAPAGGFHAATDADSEGAEGRFFLWTPDEVRAALPPEQAEAALAYWDVTPDGQLDGRSVLAVPRSLDETSAALDIPPPALRERLDAARATLYATRARRTPPHTDTKVLAAWNGLAISAFARAGAALGDAAYVERARATATFVVERLRVDGQLRRSWADGAAHGAGYLDDYAYVAAGFLDLYEATFDPRWLDEALALHETLARDFWDAQGGGFFATASSHEVTLAREKPADDGVVPSGNAVAADTLLRLAALTGDDALRQRAEATVGAVAGVLSRGPTAAPRLLAAVDWLLDRPKEVVIVRPVDGDPDADALLAVVRRTWTPNSVLTAATAGGDLEVRARRIPLLAEKTALQGRATAYVCEARVCDLPTSDPAELSRQLAAVRPLE